MNERKKLELYRINILRKRIEFLKNNPGIDRHGAFGFYSKKEIEEQENKLWQKIHQFEFAYKEHPFLKKGKK